MIFFVSECLNQTYGIECQQKCGNCNNEEPCNHVNGSCLNGCDRGWYGEKCNSGNLKICLYFL